MNKCLRQEYYGSYRSSNSIHVTWYRASAIIAVLLFAYLRTPYADTQEVQYGTQASHPPQGNGEPRSWQFGVFYSGGFTPLYQITSPELHYDLTLNFQSVALAGGKFLTPERGPGILRGRGEALIEIFPFWRAYYPAQNRVIYSNGNRTPIATSSFGPYSVHGIAATPLLFRWNFVTSGTTRNISWAQLGGGLLWTNHKFPLLGGSTSVINFTPQIGIGDNIFIKKNQSLDFSINAVHISNAGLGDNNPGVNATLQFSVGYSWWR